MQRRLAWANVALAAWCVAWVTFSPYALARSIFGVTAFVAGFSAATSVSVRRSALDKAWTVETRETMEGMARSGLFDDVDAMRAMRDNPPPGADPQDWRESLDELARHLGKREQ